MRRFSDESGWVRAAVCFAALLTHHGLRDALITALPTLAADTTKPNTYMSPKLVKDPLSRGPRVNDALGRENAFAEGNASLAFNTRRSPHVTGSRKLEEALQERDTEVASHTLALSYGTAGTELELSDAGKATHLPPSPVFSPKGSHWTGEESFARSEESYQFVITSFPLDILLSLRQRTKTIENDEVGDVQKGDSKSESAAYTVPLPPLSVFQGEKDTSLSLENAEDRVQTRLRKRSFRGQIARIHIVRSKAELENYSANHKLRRGVPGHVKARSRKVTAAAAAASPSAQWRGSNNWITNQADAQGQKEAGTMLEGRKVEVEGREAQAFTRKGQQLKEEWSLVVEGLVLSSVFWGWFFTALLADPLIDRMGVGPVLSMSVGVTGFLGLLTHAASLGGPWVLLGFRVTQGAVQGVSYPAVGRVLEGVSSTARSLVALFVFLGPSLGTGLGAGLGSLPQWYAATYTMGSLAVALTPLCLLLPPPPDAAPHKEMLWKRVLGCRGVWACMGVHVANTWMIYTLLVGLPFCLTYTPLEQRAARGWVVAVVAVSVCVVTRLCLLVAAKLAVKRPTTVLNRRRAPVVAGSVMVVAAVIVMATAGLDSMDVLVGVGVGLAGFGVGVARVGYRLNLDDMAPLGVWRVTKVLDAAAVVTAAVTPLAVSALAQADKSGWVGVWLVPLALLIPSAVVHLFLLTSNQQPWDQTGESTGGGVNEVAGAVVNGVVLPPLSVGRQSFKSARSGVTFKTARSRSRTRTLSCRTIDDDLEGDMQSAVDSSSVDCRSAVDEPDPECVSVASSSTFKSDGADMHSVVDEADGATAGQKEPGQQFGSMLVNGGTTDRTSAWLSSHHDLVLEAGGDQTSPTRAGIHAANAIYCLLW